MPNWQLQLRKELAERAERFAAANGLAHYKSCGKSPTILFEAEAATSRHGNFNDESYAAILANASWAKRLEKPHSRRGALPKDRQGDARELDSSNSSDALLMNCFCYPGAAERILDACLRTTTTGTVEVEFGVRGNVPRRNGNPDTTELDMRVGNIVCEAKLTEGDFTSQHATVVEAYRDLHDVFDASLLPRVGGRYQSYQLIRNVLAAAAHECHFVLLCDGRRPDLLQRWRTVHAAIRHPDLRARAHCLLWQEVAAACPAPLREYLCQKYGL